MFADMILGVLAIAPEGNGSLLDVNPGLIVWTIITFVLLMLLLKKLAWKPILGALDQRETAIQESLEKAERAKAEAQKVLDENQASLLKAEEESRKMIEQSRVYAEKLKAQMVNETKELQKKMMADAAAEIEREKQAVFTDLKAQVATIAVAAAEKILKEKLDKEANSRIVNQYIGEITKN